MKTFATAFALTLLLVTSPLAHSLSSDREKNIRIQADSAVVDDKNGESTYSGNVVVDQGTLHISADKVQIFSEDNKVVKVIASSADDSDNLAHYQQMPDNSDNLVKADAREITWFVKEQRLRLVGEARLSQTQDISFSGGTIHYDSAKGTVDAQSGETGKVETIFKPKQ